MSKYLVGNYLIVGFDKAGTKLWTRLAESQTLLGSQHQGISMVNSGECFSFVVLRVLHNSIYQEKNNWEI